MNKENKIKNFFFPFCEKINKTKPNESYFLFFNSKTYKEKPQTGGGAKTLFFSPKNICRLDKKIAHNEGFNPKTHLLMKQGLSRTGVRNNKESTHKAKKKNKYPLLFLVVMHKKSGAVEI